MSSNDDKKPTAPEKADPFERCESEGTYEDMELYHEYMFCIPDNNQGIWWPRASDPLLQRSNEHRGRGLHSTGTRGQAEGSAAAEQDRRRHNIPADTRGLEVQPELSKDATELGPQQQRPLHKPGQPSKLKQEVLADEAENERGEQIDKGDVISASAATDKQTTRK
ncbi:hypothetical protein PpBr36_02578 [Pyricularia pennisetigena]|uniref:hypothetical protein n=1 Tax=Pyricularia pennisetigena TaxID=1578925 RepID=UPI00114F6644|nr:hypothetical protein PpBr36_02578 [Pyricularia pennisetigena]TLS31545.1 hypothetical protein PpBr36_02578 [Pyricularia pennisetigena]